MKSKLKIGGAGNVVVPALLTLQQRGFSVRFQKSVGGTDKTWIAESGTVELLADDPVSLLGLAALAETRGHDWKATDQEIQDCLKQYGYDDEV